MPNSTYPPSGRRERRLAREARRSDWDPAARRYFVYRLLDADGDCLYIGRSCAPLNRLRDHHASGAEWPTRVVQVDAVGPFTWNEVVKREYEAIVDERPPHNVMGVTRGGWRKPSIAVAL